jgi:hypothetical protein
MIRYLKSKTAAAGRVRLAFDWPFQTALDENNRWVKLSECIPWDELAEGYYQDLADTTGCPPRMPEGLAGTVARLEDMIDLL